MVVSNGMMFKSSFMVVHQLIGKFWMVSMYIAGEGLNRPQHRDHP
jgi:hypothetical protein